MTSPMTKDDIDRVKSGQLKQAGVRVAWPNYLKAGDQVTFQEATFGTHQIPTFTRPGDSVTVTLSKATNMGHRHAAGMLFEVEWV